MAGAAGFLGSHLCDALLDRGDEVVALDNLSPARSRTWSPPRVGPASRSRSATSRCSVPVDGEVDLVMNLASPASPPAYLERPLETLAVGSEGTRRLLELAGEHSARFVQASTSEVYGDPAVHPQPESYWGNVNPIGPRSVYDESKRFGEALDDGPPASPWRQRRDRAHLQHLRPAPLARRRSRRVELRRAGAPWRAAHRLRRRRPDAELLLRRRPRGRVARARRRDRDRTGQPRQPDGAHHAGAGEPSARRDGLVLGRSCTATFPPTTPPGVVPTSRSRRACSAGRPSSASTRGSPRRSSTSASAAA